MLGFLLFLPWLFPWLFFFVLPFALSGAVPWCASIFWGLAWAEGKGELATRRLARAAGGEPGRNARRHSLDRLNASIMIKRIRLRFGPRAVARTHEAERVRWGNERSQTICQLFEEDRITTRRATAT